MWCGAQSGACWLSVSLSAINCKIHFKSQQINSLQLLKIKISLSVIVPQFFFFYSQNVYPRDFSSSNFVYFRNYKM